MTGASGFIGKNLIPKLLDYEVFTPSRKEMDVTKSEGIKAYFDKVGKVDFLIHLASSVLRGQTDNMEYYTVNTLGTANICEFGLFDKIIFTSSEDVYGRNGKFSEDSECLPDSHYAISKLLSEKFIITTKKYVILRCSCIYGMHDTRQERLIPSLMKRAVSGEILELWEDGEEIRDYLFVDDCVSAIILAMKYGDNDVFDIGYGIPIIKKDLVREVAKLSGSTVVSVFCGNRKESNRLMEIEKAKKCLGWEPQIHWREGLKRTYNWWKRNG